jgi:urease accessory protein
MHDTRLQVDKRIPGGRGLARTLLERAALLVLDWDTRSRSRFGARDSQGRELAVFLPRGSVLRDGDALVGADGSLLRVQAAAQPVLQVRAHDALALLRAAYHLGNRHVPLQLAPGLLQLEPDPVLADMLRRMGLQVLQTQAAFEPEAGAYDGAGAAHGHGHGHGHGHDSPHAHPVHEHEHGTAHAYDAAGAPGAERGRE